MSSNIEKTIPAHRKEDYKLACLIQDQLESKYKNHKLLFHGTSLSNANSMRENSNDRVSNVELAKKLCSDFGATLTEVLNDSDAGYFLSSFVLGKQFNGISRDQEIYTATNFYRAADYASRGPEWKYHFLLYFACKDLGIEFNVGLHIPKAERWILNHREQPVVVVLDATHYPNFPVEDSILQNFSLGATAILSYPLPKTVEVLEIIEWNPTPEEPR